MRSRIRILLLLAVLLTLAAPQADAGPLQFLGKYSGLTAAGKMAGKGASAVGKAVAKAAVKTAQAVY